jgi:hypothetical protein
VRSSFTESVPQIPSRARVTGRLRAAAGRAVADGGRTVAQAAREWGLSWPVVNAAFVDHAMAVLPEEPDPVAVLGIDETRRGKPRFAVDPETGALEQVTDRWHTGFVDLTGNQGLLGQVEGRSAGAAGSWLAARTQQWRDGVQAVAIGMCSAFRAAVREHLPHATLVVRADMGESTGVSGWKRAARPACRDLGAAFVLVVVSMGWLQGHLTGSGADVAYTTVSTIITGLVVFGLTRLTNLVTELHTARRELAEPAVAEERLRFARDLHDMLG